jgi:HEPN superfamily Apea-like protein
LIITRESRRSEIHHFLGHCPLHPDEDRTIRQTQLRIDPGGPWLKVHGPAFCSKEGSLEHDPLLRPDQLTIDRYAKWIELHAKLDGLTWVVARPFKGAVQTRVLLFTTLIEGFHDALDGYDKAKFPEVDKDVLHRILEAMRAAAVAQAAAEGLDSRFVEKADGQDLSSVENAVQFHTRVSYQERAKAIVTEVCSVIPEIVESITNLPQRLTKTRNDLAHQSRKDREKPLETRVLEWRVASEATSWLLRCLLLLRAGIEPDVLHERLLFFQRFGYFRANTAQHVNELGWELPEAN